MYCYGDKLTCGEAVSDYGAANFMQHTMSVCPGAAIYSAPEAFTKNQTVKVCRLVL